MPNDPRFEILWNKLKELEDEVEKVKDMIKYTGVESFEVVPQDDSQVQKLAKEGKLSSPEPQKEDNSSKE